MLLYISLTLSKILTWLYFNNAIFTFDRRTMEVWFAYHITVPSLVKWLPWNHVEIRKTDDFGLQSSTSLYIQQCNLKCAVLSIIKKVM